jgi:hypothetical protein
MQLRISLIGVTPAIWRRLLVPGEIKLSKLHTIFQAAMGWKDSHLHSFEIDGELYSTPYAEQDDDVDEINEETVVFSDVVSDGSRFFYEYDFGDSWRHEVVVESVDAMPTILKSAVCLDGERACPPEDCGGTRRYGALLEAMHDPDHAEPSVDVSGAGRFDPELFNVAIVNAALQQVR